MWMFFYGDGNLMLYFSMYSLYQWLEYRGIQNIDYNVMWKANISLKIKIFILLVKKNRALTKFNLAKKGWIGITQFYVL
jgi:zinc-binding in reverse transcriptase